MKFKQVYVAALAASEVKAINKEFASTKELWRATLNKYLE